MGRSADVEACWSDLRQWLRDHAPKAHDALRAGVAPDDPRLRRAAADGAWPEDLRSWFALQGGVGRDHGACLLLGGAPMSLDESIAVVRFAGSGTEETDPGALGVGMDDVHAGVDGLAGEQISFFSAGLLPVADDFAGSHVVVDLRPGPRRGCVTLFEMGVGTAYLWGVSWESIGGFLSACRDALAEGAPLAGLVPVVDGGGVRWKPSPGDAPTPLRESSRDRGARFWATVGAACGEQWLRSDTEALGVVDHGLAILLSLGPKDLMAATSDEPPVVGDVTFNVLLGACVHHACERAGITPPPWATHPSRRFDQEDPATIPPMPSLAGARPEVFGQHGLAFAEPGERIAGWRGVAALEDGTSR
ncbi:MAG: hypothetical protein GC157_02855 [Frankiales bacterium]|nr:hypothetical protein [Frankiales bacterium]